MIRRLMHHAVLMICLGLSACATLTLPTYQSSVDNTQALLSQKAPVAVGPFSASDGVENKRLSVRGSPLSSSQDNQFSAYLRSALVRELETAGRLDPNSNISIEAVLTQNELSAAGARTGTARLGATFIVTRDGEEVFRKPMQVEHSWESSFIGAIAIPAAVQNYSTAVQKLLAALLADAEFNKSIE